MFVLAEETRNKINQMRYENSWSQLDLGRKAGLRQMDISRLINGKPGVGREKASRLCEVLGIELVEGDYSGTDQRLVVDKETVDYLQGKARKKKIHYGAKLQYQVVPLYDVQASAGHGSYIGLEKVVKNYEMPQEWLPQKGRLGMVSVTGDSMYPTLNTGDKVLVDFESGYQSDGLYVIRIEDTLNVKRLQRMFGGIKIISDNTLYSEQQIEKEDGIDFAVIGRVVMLVRHT